MISPPLAPSCENLKVNYSNANRSSYVTVDPSHIPQAPPARRAASVAGLGTMPATRHDGLGSFRRRRVKGGLGLSDTESPAPRPGGGAGGLGLRGSPDPTRQVRVGLAAMAAEPTTALLVAHAAPP